MTGAPVVVVGHGSAVLAVVVVVGAGVVVVVTGSPAKWMNVKPFSAASSEARATKQNWPAAT